jgi:hypothetical protein
MYSRELWLEIGVKLLVVLGFEKLEVLNYMFIRLCSDKILT